MQRVRLTAGRVAAFSCPPGQQQAFLRDSEVPALALRATAAGAKAYVFEAKLHRRTVRVTIGDPAHWTIEAARARARELAALVDKGIDPRDEAKRQQQQREAERARQQAAQVCALDVWREYCEERRRAWGQRHHAEHLRYADPGGAPRKRGGGVTDPGILHGLLNRPLAHLTPQRIEAWAAEHAALRPTMARLAHRMLRTFLNWCARKEAYAAVLPATNPAATVEVRETLGESKPKRDALLRDQLRPWFEAARQQDPVIAAYLQALLLTGARPGELLRLGWADVDLRWRSLTLRDKVEGERIIPLTPYVARLLAALPRRGPYVFMSGRTAGPIASPNHQALRVCRMAGVPPVTLHGLRRSFKSLTEWVEVPVGVVAQIMGHKPSATAEKHYTVRPLDLLAKWHAKIEAWILEQAGIEAPSAGDAGQRLRVVA